MSALQTIPSMSPAAIDNVRAVEEHDAQLPQVAIETHHVIHGGMYARTILIPASVRLTGVLVKIPTTLTIAGHVQVFDGDRIFEIDGYQVIPASAGRKQAFFALRDTYLTMAFATQATSVEEAENEFTDEPERLTSRHTDGNTEIITGD